MTVGYEGRVHDEPSRRSPAGSASQPDLMMMMMTVMMVVTMMLMMMTIIAMMIMMMMVMMMMVVVVVVGKEEQKGKEKERQSLYTLTPDRPPLRPEYVMDLYFRGTPGMGEGGGEGSGKWMAATLYPVVAVAPR